jgi:hypothetical protein
VGDALAYWSDVGLLAMCPEEVVPLLTVPLIGVLSGTVTLLSCPLIRLRLLFWFTLSGPLVSTVPFSSGLGTGGMAGKR